MKSRWIWSALICTVLLIGCSDDAPEVIEDDSSQGSPLEGSAQIQVFHDEVDGQPVVVAGSGQQQIIVSFWRTLPSGEVLDFTPVRGQMPNLLQDQHGNIYNIFGEAVEGPNQGRVLLSTHGFMGYWMAFPSFYDQVEIYGEGSAPIHEPVEGTGGWRIPHDKVFAATSKDAIPAIDAPQFQVIKPDPTGGIDLGTEIVEDDLVIGVSIGGEYHLYPHKILDWHEIVNDELAGEPFSLIYCPLTGTGNVWSRVIGGEETTFGVSGLLYNSNIVPYDRKTESIWSQLYGGSVLGELSGQVQPNFHVVETTWAKWKQMFNGPLILSFETGHNRSYQRYPYGDYRTNHEAIYFPLSRQDDRLPAKERVHAIVVGKKAKVYRFASF